MPSTELSDANTWAAGIRRSHCAGRSRIVRRPTAAHGNSGRSAPLPAVPGAPPAAPGIAMNRTLGYLVSRSGERLQRTAPHPSPQPQSLHLAREHNHDDVTLSWSRPPRCGIVVVARPGRGTVPAPRAADGTPGARHSFPVTPTAPFLPRHRHETGLSARFNAMRSGVQRANPFPAAPR
jgi:hypothetical protein